MSFEAEVIPLFIGGVAIVSALELIAGCVLLRNLREARNRLIAHTVCMIIAQLFLIRSIFANWLGVKLKIASISNSVNIGMFGLFWAVSVVLLLSAIGSLTESNKKES